MALKFSYLADSPELVPQIIRWWHSSWADRMGPDLARSEQQLRENLSVDSLPLHIVAFVDGEAAGSAALKEQELGSLYPDRQNWLGSVFVAEAFRGRGIASALSRQVIVLAKARLMRRLHLQTTSLDGGLYARLGWQPVERFEYRGEQTLLMQRPL